ncbi:MAG: hypothetical protein ACE5F9_03285 [Phycisphaerae bacterium]
MIGIDRLLKMAGYKQGRVGRWTPGAMGLDARAFTGTDGEAYRITR